MNTNRTLLASTGVLTAGDAIVIGTMDVVVVHGCGFDEDGENGKESESREELHDDAVWKGVWGKSVVVREEEEALFQKGGKVGTV